MNRCLALIAAASIAAPALAAPHIAAAQSYRDYGASDPCREEQRAAAKRGTVIGGLGGALAGSAVAGRGDRTEGAIIGGAIGAVAGHEIARKRVSCTSYPKRIRQTEYSRSKCHWVQESRDGRMDGFEVCRGRDGVWRPSGRT